MTTKATSKDVDMRKRARWVSSQQLAFTALTFVLGNTLVAAPPTPRDVSNGELFAEKRGTVIDTQSGQGISDATVIIDWLTQSTGVNGVVSGSQWCDLQDMTATDEHGRFSIPAVDKSKLDMSNVGTFQNFLPWGTSSTVHKMTYRIYVYKPGYVRVGDEEKIYAAKFGAGFEWESVPDVVSQSNPVVIAPIRLGRSHLDAESRWVYPARLDSATHCSGRMSESKDAPRFHEFQEILAAGIASLPCQMPANAKIAPGSSYALRSMIHDSRFEKQLIAAVGGVAETNVTMQAGVLCRATAGLPSPP